jgi:hypothetical protein
LSGVPQSQEESVAANWQTEQRNKGTRQGVRIETDHPAREEYGDASCLATGFAFSDSPPRIGCSVMSLLVVGSVALDSVYTPFGETADALGGSAVFFSVAASLLNPVQVVGVIGNDYPTAELDRLADRGIDWSGVERAEGESFRWKGKYSYDLQSRETLETRLGVFADFDPKLPDAWRSAKYLFLGNIDPKLQLGVAGCCWRWFCLPRSSCSGSER